jgi:hypothetical protein
VSKREMGLEPIGIEIAVSDSGGCSRVDLLHGLVLVSFCCGRVQRETTMLVNEA